MRPRLLSSLSLSILAAAAVALGAALVADSPRGVIPPVPLEPGRPITREIGPEEVHAYEIDLPAGSVLRAIVEQQGADIEVTVVGPRQRELLRLDGPTAELGPEVVVVVVETGGAHRIEIRELWGRVGYRLRAEPPRPASGQDRLAAKASAHLAVGSRARSDERLDEAQAELEAAIRAAEQAGEPELAALAAVQRGRVLLSRRELAAAVASFEAAVPLWRGTAHEVLLINWIARCRLDQGAFRAAETLSRRALDLSRHRSRFQEATALSSLGAALSQLGEFGEAAYRLGTSRESWREFDAPVNAALDLANLGDLELSLGRPEAALEVYREGLELARRSGRRDILASLLLKVEVARRDLGLPTAGIAELQRVLEIALLSGDQKVTTQAELALGTALRRQGRLEQALLMFQQAERRAHGLGRRLHAIAATNVAHTLDLLGQKEHVIERFASALETFESTGEIGAAASVRYGLALAHARAGRLEETWSALEKALESYDRLRASPSDIDARVTFLASKKEVHELAVRVLSELAERYPGQGFVELAVERAERTRSRALADELAEARTAPARAVDPPLAERLLQAEERLRQLDRARRFLGDVSEELRSRIRQAELELEAVRAEARLSDPRRTDLAAPSPLRLGEIRSRVLDSETLLLVYSLGEPESFLWVVGQSGSVIERRLAGRARIENLIDRAYESLSTGRRAGVDEAVRKLSKELLPRDILGRSRLAIVADGMLQAIPFQALLDPDAPPGADQLLVDAHEIVAIPSATVLDLLRRDRPGRQPDLRVAVFADPVFSADDERLGGRARALASERGAPLSLRLMGDGSSTHFDLRRLEASGREARSILSLFPPEQGFAAIGFAATREAAMDAELGRYRILHFATHSLPDREHPGLFALAFSQLDAQGRPLPDHLLRSYEVYGLDLPADLVVLSACETGLGRAQWGEGLLGLTRAFMYAGARRVVVSLWPVNDTATAELMEIFYRRMIGDGLPEAEALRAAQLEMSRIPGREAPYYWAGFVLQGDWR